MECSLLNRMDEDDRTNSDGRGQNSNMCLSPFGIPSNNLHMCWTADVERGRRRRSGGGSNSGISSRTTEMKSILDQTGGRRRVVLFDDEMDSNDESKERKLRDVENLNK